MEPRKTPSDRHRGVLNNKSEKTGGRPLCRRAAGSTVSPRRQRTPNAATNPAHERRGLFAYRKGAEGVRVCGHGLRSSERRSGSAGVVCRGSWGRASVRRPLCFWRVHQRPLVATSHTHHTHTTEKSQKRTRPRLRGAAHPLKGPPTTHHGEQELRGTPWWLLAGQPHTVQDYTPVKTDATRMAACRWQL